MHRNDALNETISLSDRFGLIISYMEPDQEVYFDMVDGLLKQHGITLDREELRVKQAAGKKNIPVAQDVWLNNL